MSMATKRTAKELAWLHHWRNLGVFFKADQPIPERLAPKMPRKRSRAIIAMFALTGLLAACTISVGLGLLIAAGGVFLQEVKS